MRLPMYLASAGRIWRLRTVKVQRGRFRMWDIIALINCPSVRRANPKGDVLDMSAI